jgi:hypothetical protein
LAASFSPDLQGVLGFRRRFYAKIKGCSTSHDLWNDQRPLVKDRRLQRSDDQPRIPDNTLIKQWRLRNRNHDPVISPDSDVIGKRRTGIDQTRQKRRVSLLQGQAIRVRTAVKPRYKA